MLVKNIYKSKNIKIRWGTPPPSPPKEVKKMNERFTDGILTTTNNIATIIIELQKQVKVMNEEIQTLKQYIIYIREYTDTPLI